jgi:hypothetical protein
MLQNQFPPEIDMEFGAMSGAQYDLNPNSRLGLTSGGVQTNVFDMVLSR